MEMLASPRKLGSWMGENYYVALLNTCSGIFKLYFKFWKGQKSLASLREGLSEACCAILQPQAPARVFCVPVGSFHEKRQGRQVEGARQGTQSSDFPCQ